MTLTAEDREQIESELDLIRTHQANLLWNECVSDDARRRRDETVGRIGPEIERLERLLNEPRQT